MSVTLILQEWYSKNKRDLPWRNTKDPFRIWLSEIILQQTRVEQGTPYYLRFTERFSDVRSLADASEDEVLKLWQGLGYYSRARNMHHASKEIASNFNGIFPSSYNEIIKLKGIGEYTAAAISSFAFNEPCAVVDGNVFRFLSRYFGIDIPINSQSGKKKFIETANEILDQNQPGIHNQAIMEFGSRQCKPQNPDCETCPFSISCIARIENRIQELPVKIKNIKVRERFLNYFLVKEKTSLYLNKRVGKDIWQNMYDFPLIETEKRLSEKELLESNQWKVLFGNKKIRILSISNEIKHLLSHQRLYARFWNIEFELYYPDFSEQFLLVKDEELRNFALPRLIDSYLENNI